ncbi:hypothetical protein [Flavobacterium sp. JAS]|uniref:hypothetical protein n=1 Tax=Flavobacterium sp. JAS TaxID=2897329 RepID=UPI001E3A2FC4|nr:hypothetical protein [Flavobacterium sp. JAS]MCD0470162.1 hypothetical protein [Flavobacterium sp. JAS]
MDNEKIKILRNKFSIPLDAAIRLLKKNNGDVLLCEKEFHDNNIEQICKKTESDYEAAKENYEICNYDIRKAIERINQKQVIITTGNNPNTKIGFILWPENAAGEFYKTDKRNDVFISAEDFDVVLKDFKSVFSLLDVSNDFEQESFDVLGNNFFDNKTCRQIVEQISQIESNDKQVQNFLTELINWLNDKLTYADYIVVYGNL